MSDPVFAALQEARSLALRVMDKNIGPLSDQAREALGTLNAVLDDLPTAEEAQAAYGAASSQSRTENSR